MQPLKVQATGVLLFLFIPLVLFLYVRHPEPVWASLIGGVVVMMGHRLLARPYMERALPVKCAWCNRILPPDGNEVLELGEIRALCCRGHRRPSAKFFGFLESWRWVLRAGIFLPLLLLLGTLAAAAFGVEAPLDDVTAFFKLVIGLTVNLAAFGYLLAPERTPSSVPFPVHNFFLLGIRNLLWVFRLVGIWWIWQGVRHFLDV